MYISGEEGRSFVLSIENVIKGEAVDFEKVHSLDGTYIVNKYTGGTKNEDSKVKGEFDEEDIIAVE